MPLATARNIAGVRAVFGETYPDPVRVVSIGVPIEQLLEDVKCKDWHSVSIEFCGGTHVKHTNEIKDMVVLQEEGIAKGIRRIVAVTGTLAHEVQREAEEWDKRVSQLEHMDYNSEKETKTKEWQHELGKVEISTLAKSKLRERFAKIVKANLDHQKTAQKAENKRVLDEVTQHFEKNKENKTLVLSLPVSAGSKAVQEALKVVSTKQKDKTLYLLGKSEDGKVLHGCHVSAEAQKKGADAAKWSSEVAGLVGGKAGGKGATSLGQGTNPDKVDDAVELARKYLQDLKL